MYIISSVLNVIFADLRVAAVLVEEQREGELHVLGELDQRHLLITGYYQVIQLLSIITIL